MSLESATWVTQLSTGNPQAVDPRSEGDDHLRLIKTVVQTELSPANRQWVYTGDSANWVTSTSITIDGDQTGKYETGRRAKIVGSSTGTVYGEILSSTYSANTVINFGLDEGAFTNERLTPYLSLLTPANTALPNLGKKTKPTTTERVNNTRTADEALTGFAMVANRFYRIHGTLLFDADSSAGQGFSIAFNYSQTPQSSIHMIHGIDGSSNIYSDTVLGGNPASMTVFSESANPVVRIEGVIQSHATLASTVDLLWAQQSTDAGNSAKLLLGSWLEVAL